MTKTFECIHQRRKKCNRGTGQGEKMLGIKIVQIWFWSSCDDHWPRWLWKLTITVLGIKMVQYDFGPRDDHWPRSLVVNTTFEWKGFVENLRYVRSPYIRNSSVNSYREKQSKKGLVVLLIRYQEAGNENVIFILAQFKKNLFGVKRCLCIVWDKYARRDWDATPENFCYLNLFNFVMKMV